MPASPPGYQRYRLDADPSIGVVAWVLAVGWLLAVVVLAVLVVLNYEHYTAVGVIAIILVTAGVHEALHAVVGRAFGLQVAGGFEFDGLASGPYILSHGEFQTRRESALMAAAPTLVLTPVFLLVGVVGAPALSLVALMGLFVNTLGAVFDLRAVVTTLRLPADTLEYHTVDGEVHYYAPTG